MGLQPGDRLVGARTPGVVNGRPGIRAFTTAEELAAFVAEVDGFRPGSPIAISVRWTYKVPFLNPAEGEVALDEVVTTKRDNPLMTLLAGTDREWARTPQGHYETSIAGDSKLLGWHTNGTFRRPEATDYVPIIAHEAAMRRRDVLDRLFATGDPVQASR